MVIHGPLTLLLVSVFGSDLTQRSVYDCVRRSYYGTYGMRRAYILDETCRTSSVSVLDLGTTVRLHDRDDLIWVDRGRVDPSLYEESFETELGWLLGNLTDFRASSHLVVGQAPLKRPSKRFEVLHRAQDGALLSVQPSLLEAMESKLPRFWQHMVFPSAPIPLFPVPEEAKERLRRMLPTIHYNHVVASIVNGISVRGLQRDIQYLTGEDPSSDIFSRHSFSEGAVRAATWIKAQVEATGASCDLRPFQEGFAPNVVCEYPASDNTTETVILGAHYDDRGSFGSTRAPGANDDGSGTGALLGIAHAIARRHVMFRRRVQLCAFAGEEQMMVGSRAYAKELKEKGVDIVLMVQADMLAFHADGEPPQLGLSNPALVGTAEVTQILANVSAIYSPELTVGYSPYPGGSDHQSFHEYGFPAAQVYERAGLIKDPMYHDSGDLSEREGYDFGQIKSIAKVKLAAVLHVAGFEMLDPNTLDP